MTERNRTQYQGLLLPDVRLRDPSTAFWKAQSTVSEQSPYPGRPVPSRDTEALLLSEGSMESSTVLDVLAVEGGPVGRDTRAAGLAWKNSTDASDEYRGREIPATISSWEIVDYVGAGSPNDGYLSPHIVTLKTEAYRDRVVLVASYEAGTSGASDVVCWYRTPDGTISSRITIHDATTDFTALYPCLVECGDRLFCLYWARGIGSASDRYYVRVQMSLDGGATWEVVRSAASINDDLFQSVGFVGSADYQVGRIRAQYLNGQVSVVAHLQRNLNSATATEAADVFIQWGSTNLATKLERVTITAAAAKADGTSGGYHDMVVAGDAFGLVWIQPNGNLYWARYGSAYQSLDVVENQNNVVPVIQDAAELNTSPDRIADADIAATVDDIGLVWIYVRLAQPTSNDDEDLTVVCYSRNDLGTVERVGTSDDSPGTGTSAVYNGGRNGSGAHYAELFIRDFAVTWQRGRAIMAHRWTEAGGAQNESMALCYLGGYSDLTIAPILDAAQLVDRHPWQRTWLPMDRLQDLTNWAAATTGTPTDVISATGFESIAGTSGDQLRLTTTDGTTGELLLVAQFTAQASGASTGIDSDEAALSFRVDDGSNCCEIGIYLTSGAFGVWDRLAPARITNRNVDDVVRQFRLAVFQEEGGGLQRCQVWHRAYDRSEDRQWTSVGQFNLTDGGATGVATNRVEVGHLSAVTSAATLNLYELQFTIGDLSTRTCLAGSVYTWDGAFINPDDLGLTPLSSLPVYLSGGVSVRGVDGPAMASDAWTISAAHEYPVERVWPSYSRSPRVRWRSTDDSSQQTVAVALDPTLLGTDDSEVGAPVYALFLGGVNWRTGELQRYTGGAWVKVADIDTADAFGTLAYTRVGASVVPNGDTTYQIAGQELVGWDLRTIGASPNVVRRIKGNRGGRWATGTSAGPRVRVHLDGVAGTDPASGNAVLCSRNVAIVFDHDPSVDVAGWRIVIDVQDTVEGHFEIGTMMLGPVYVAGQPFDWGRDIEQVLGTAYRQQQDGQTLATHQAPAGLAVQVAFTGGVDTRQFHDGTAEPTYITTTATSGIEGAATWAASIYDLQHAVDEVGTHPVVYLPRIERDVAGDVRTLTRWYEYLYCRIPDGLSITSSIGDEGTDETLTVGTVTLEAEL